MAINNFKAFRIHALCFVAGVTTSLFLLWLCGLSVVSNPTHIHRLKQCPKCSHEKQEIKINRLKKYSCHETFENISDVRYLFVVKECANPSENITTTLILTHPVTENLVLENVTKNSLYKFARVILVAYKSEIALIDNTDWYYRLFNTTFFTVDVDSFASYGQALNRALDLVSTPLVLVAPRIAYMNSDDIKGQSLDVQRLIRMLETIQEAEIVGGAIKDVRTGHWSRGCYQTREAMYTLKFTAGYQHSFHECLFCDHISSPFLARTSFMKKLRFPKDDHGLFLDFFHRVKKTKTITLSCPDVMFYVNPVSESDSDLQAFGKRWNIGQIIEADGRKRRLLYFRDGPHDKRDKTSIKKECSKQRWEKSLARHPGCRHNLAQFIQYVCKTLSDAGIHYEINEGTLLGALKFDYVLPWELDADIDVLAPYKEVVEKVVPIFQRDGVEIIDHGEANFNVDLWLYGWKCELYMYNASKVTPYPGPQTRINLGGEWVYTLENPGYYMRVRYGQEIFRHVEHWAHLGKNTGWAPYDAGKFLKCTTPGHQGCLDEFEADGNIQFLDIM